MTASKIEHEAKAKAEESTPPLIIYRAIICERALIDPLTKLHTYVSAADVLKVPEHILGQYVGIPAHFAICGFGEYELRLVWVTDAGERVPAGDKSDKVTLRGRTPFVASQIRLPVAPGWHRLTLDWRLNETEEWHLSDFGYSIEVVKLLPPTTTPAS